MIHHSRIVAELQEGDILSHGLTQSVVKLLELANVGNAWVTTQRLDMDPAPLPVRKLRKLTDRVIVVEQPEPMLAARYALQKVKLRLKQNMSADTLAVCNSIIDEALRKLGAI